MFRSELGRGFFLATHRVELGNVIVTAAHCLPRLPEANILQTPTEEFVYHGLVGMLGGSRPRVPTQCYFVDPVADVAVLGRPEPNEFLTLSDDYDSLLKGRPALRLDFSDSWTPAPGLAVTGKPREQKEGPVWLLDREGEWVKGTARVGGGTVLIEVFSSSAPIAKPGCSGSPVLDDDGRVVGMVTNGPGWTMADSVVLKTCLPGWLLALAKGETDATSAQ